LSFHQLTSIGLFPVFGDYKQSFHEHSHTSLCVDMHFHFSWVNS
jgi:hypothetical protein